MKKIYTICSILALCGIIYGCSTKSTDPISHTEVVFDTVVTIQLYDTTDSKLLDECFSLCHKYEAMFSRTIESSEISQINHSNGLPVSVSPETLELVQKAVHYSELSNGLFDITIAPLSELWDFKNNTNTIPDSTVINEAKAHVDYRNITIDPSKSTIQLADPDSSLDLGGIAKGYIADRIKDFLVENNIEHALINLGGNVLAIGGKPDNTPFNIGIQEPFSDRGETISSVKTASSSVVTSGIYERYFEKDNIVYHHILDPVTGYPYETDLYGVTILSSSSADGDALSTICLSLGLEKGLEFINQTDGVEAMFITDKKELYYSEKFNSFE